VKFLDRSSIKRNIMTIYITTTLVTFAIVFYVLLHMPHQIEHFDRVS